MPWKALLPYHISHRIKPKLHISALRSKRQPLTLYGGQFTLSTQLITLNYPVLLFHWRSTTVSLETYPLYKRSSCIRWLVYRAWCETVRLRFRVHHNPSPSTHTATHPPTFHRLGWRSRILQRLFDRGYFYCPVVWGRKNPWPPSLCTHLIISYLPMCFPVWDLFE